MWWRAKERRPVAPNGSRPSRRIVGEPTIAAVRRPPAFDPLKDRFDVDQSFIAKHPTESIVRGEPVRAAVEVLEHHAEGSSCCFFHASIPGLWWNRGKTQRNRLRPGLWHQKSMPTAGSSSAAKPRVRSEPTSAWMPWRWRFGTGETSTGSSIIPTEPGQYLAIRYTERLGEAGAANSVGSKGDSYDNALAETIIGLYKAELIRRRGPWKGIDDVEYATLEWVDWFNHRRLLEPIGDVPPAEFEADYWGKEDSDDPATLRDPSLR